MANTSSNSMSVADIDKFRIKNASSSLSIGNTTSSEYLPKSVKAIRDTHKVGQHDGSIKRGTSTAALQALNNLLARHQQHSQIEIIPPTAAATLSQDVTSLKSNNASTHYSPVSSTAVAAASPSRLSNAIFSGTTLSMSTQKAANTIPSIVKEKEAAICTVDNTIPKEDERNSHHEPSVSTVIAQPSDAPADTSHVQFGYNIRSEVSQYNKDPSSNPSSRRSSITSNITPESYILSYRNRMLQWIIHPNHSQLDEQDRKLDDDYINRVASNFNNFSSSKVGFSYSNIKTVCLLLMLS